MPEQVLALTQTVARIKLGWMRTRSIVLWIVAVTNGVKQARACTKAAT
ncbi:MAG: hypothetical protein H0V79_06790 [Actinobacteria bacterium]|nr:hypothetical protein [Actinomycetota bacterium]